jgi:hypothetical protein
MEKKICVKGEKELFLPLLIHTVSLRHLLIHPLLGTKHRPWTGK